MKAGWQTEPLRMVCQFSNGLWKGKKPPFVNVGVIRNTSFTKEGTLDDSDIVYLDVEEKKLEKRQPQIRRHHPRKVWRWAEASGRASCPI